MTATDPDNSLNGSIVYMFGSTTSYPQFEIDPLGMVYLNISYHTFLLCQNCYYWPSLNIVLKNIVCIMEALTLEKWLLFTYLSFIILEEQSYHIFGSDMDVFAPLILPEIASQYQPWADNFLSAWPQQQHEWYQPFIVGIVIGKESSILIIN